MALAGASALAAGGAHTCVLGLSGTVHCWGDASWGATQPPAGLSALALSAGGRHTCAVAVNGTVVCFGDDRAGQAPGLVALPGAQVALATGTSHSCALSNAGGIRCWGGGSSGQTVAPGIVASLHVAVAAAGDRSCGLSLTGAVTCWGQLPGVPSEGRIKPRAVLAVGPFHTCTLDEQALGGRLSCWGCGVGVDSGQCAVPLLQLAGTVAIATGRTFTCALSSYGSVACFGTGPALAVHAAAAAGNQVALAAGPDHACSLSSGGGVVCWGDGSAGQLVAVPAPAAGTALPLPCTRPCGELYMGPGCAFCSAGAYTASDNSCTRCPTWREIATSAVDLAWYAGGLLMLGIAFSFVTLSIVRIAAGGIVKESFRHYARLAIVFWSLMQLHAQVLQVTYSKGGFTPIMASLYSVLQRFNWEVNGVSIGSFPSKCLYTPADPLFTAVTVLMLSLLVLLVRFRAILCCSRLPAVGLTDAEWHDFNVDFHQEVVKVSASRAAQAGAEQPGTSLVRSWRATFSTTRRIITRGTSSLTVEEEQREARGRAKAAAEMAARAAVRSRLSRCLRIGFDFDALRPVLQSACCTALVLLYSPAAARAFSTLTCIDKEVTVQTYREALKGDGSTLARLGIPLRSIGADDPYANQTISVSVQVGDKLVVCGEGVQKIMSSWGAIIAGAYVAGLPMLLLFLGRQLIQDLPSSNTSEADRDAGASPPKLEHAVRATAPTMEKAADHTADSHLSHAVDGLDGLQTPSNTLSTNPMLKKIQGGPHAARAASASSRIIGTATAVMTSRRVKGAAAAASDDAVESHPNLAATDHDEMQVTTNPLWRNTLQDSVKGPQAASPPPIRKTGAAATASFRHSIQGAAADDDEAVSEIATSHSQKLFRPAFLPVAKHAALPAWLAAPGLAVFMLHGEYRPNKFWVRIVELMFALVLALARAWPVLSPSDVNSHTTIVVIFAVAILVIMVIHQPYAETFDWGLAVKVGNLLLLLASAALVHVCQLLLFEEEAAIVRALSSLNATDTGRAGSAAAAPAIIIPSYLPAAYNALNTSTFALFIIFFFFTLVVFMRSLYNKARGQKEGLAADGRAPPPKPTFFESLSPRKMKGDGRKDPPPGPIAATATAASHQPRVSSMAPSRQSIAAVGGPNRPRR